MKKNRKRRRKRAKGGKRSVSRPVEPTAENANRGSHRGRYRSGPVFGLGQLHEEKPTAEPASEEPEREHEEVSTSLPALHTEAKSDKTAPPVRGQTITLQGETVPGDFIFSAQTSNLSAERAGGCDGCSDNCLRVRGILTVTYTVNPTVTLPSISDYPDLTPCQQQRVRDAIDNVLAPHEQRHVRAFQTYNGTTTRQFDITICRSEWNEAYVREMARPEQEARQQAAQAASDALDPFHFTVDLDCEDEEQPEGEGDEGGKRQSESEAAE